MNDDQPPGPAGTDAPIPGRELDRALAGLGLRIAERQVQRSRRRRAMGWLGLGAIMALGGVALGAFDSETPDPEAAGDAAVGDASMVRATGCFDPSLGANAADGRTISAIAAPQLLNRGDLIRAMGDAFPPAALPADGGGAAVVHFRVGLDGSVEETVLARSSGSEEIDRAAMRMAERFEFGPAMDGPTPVAAWARVPITFSPDRTPCALCRRIPTPELLGRAC